MELTETASTRSWFNAPEVMNVAVSHRLCTNGLHVDIRHIWWNETVRGRVNFEKNSVEYVLKGGHSATWLVNDTKGKCAGVGAAMFAPQGWECDLECGPSDMVKMCLTIDDKAAVLHRMLAAPGEQAAQYDIRNEHTVNVLRRLANEVRSPGFAYDMLTDALVSQLFIEIYRSGMISEGNDESHNRKIKVHEVLDYIDRRINENLSISQIAATFGFNSRTLLRQVHKETGKSIIEYIARMRINKAKRELDEGKPIKIVAFDCGFQSASSFSTAFRRATGVSPGRFRTVIQS